MRTNDLKDIAFDTSIMIEALKKFEREIGKDFIVGGSLALYQHGFDCQPNDIDLELKTDDPYTIKTLNLLNSTYQGYDDSCRYPTVNNHYRFCFHQIIFDVWVVKEFDYKSFLCRDDVRYADIMSILKKKIALKREKDYKDLFKYSKQIISLIGDENEGME